MKERKNGCLDKPDNSNATNYDIELLFVVHCQYKQSICIKNRASPRPSLRPHQKKKSPQKVPLSIIKGLNFY